MIEGADGKMYTEAFLSEIRELNQSFFVAIRSTLEKTPFADCRQTMHEYIRQFEETELKHNYKPSTTTVPVKRMGLSEPFNTKSVKFANGSSPITIKEESEEEPPKKEPDTPHPFSNSLQLSRATATTSLLGPFQFKAPVTSTSESEPPKLSLITPPKPVDSSAPTAAPSFSFQFKPSQAPAEKNSESSLFSTNNTSTQPFKFNLSNNGSAISNGPFGSGAASTAASNMDNENDEDDDDVPPEPEAVEVKEQGAIYEKPCQLFFRVFKGEFKY